MSDPVLEATAPQSPVKTAAAVYVQGLREFADWAEAHPDVLDSYDYSGELATVYLYRSTRDELAETVRVLGGHREKTVDGGYFKVARRFGPITVQVYTGRDQVCERIVTGTREVTATVRDPALLEKVPLVTVVREEEIIEWRCPDTILAEVVS